MNFFVIYYYCQGPCDIGYEMFYGRYINEKEKMTFRCMRFTEMAEKRGNVTILGHFTAAHIFCGDYRRYEDIKPLLSLRFCNSFSAYRILCMVNETEFNWKKKFRSAAKLFKKKTQNNWIYSLPDLILLLPEEASIRSRKCSIKFHFMFFSSFRTFRGSQ